MGETGEATSGNRTSIQITAASNGGSVSLKPGAEGEAILHVYGNPAAGLTPPWMTVSFPDSLRRLRVEVAEATNVGLDLTGHSELTVEIEGEGKSSRLVLAPGDVAAIMISTAIAEVRPTRNVGSYGRVSIGELSVSSGGLVVMGSINAAEVKVQGKVTVRSNDARIDKLRIAPGSELFCALDKRGVVGDLAMLRTASDQPNERFILERSSTLTVERCTDVAVAVEERASLRVDNFCAFLDVTGPGEVSLAGADAVTFGSPAVTLHLDPHGQVIAATGAVRFGRVASAHISGNGGPSGLLVEAVETNADSLENLSLTNVTFPVSLTGRRTISALREHADSVTPLLTDDIPGRGSWRLPSRVPRPLLNDLLMQSEFTRSLATLAGERGAPASVRTDLAWSAYRMRNASAPGRTERWVLSAYRLIGYGERAMPPVALYLGVALILATWSLRGRGIDLSVTGFATFLEAFGSWLTTPLHLLRLTEGPPPAFTFREPWETFARIALAVPFVTAVLALRNYVKEGHRPKS